MRVCQASGVQPVSIACRVAELAMYDAGDAAQREVFRHVAADGSETAYTWAQLDQRSSQLASALTERGLGFGERALQINAAGFL